MKHIERWHNMALCERCLWDLYYLDINPMTKCFMKSVERCMLCSVCMTFTVGFLEYKTHGKVNGNIRKSNRKCMCLK